jgi:hypothetical protein
MPSDQIYLLQSNIYEQCQYDAIFITLACAHETLLLLEMHDHKDRGRFSDSHSERRFEIYVTRVIRSLERYQVLLEMHIRYTCYRPEIL